uniref:Uncharacterized protein n=1 Tax=Arundo donax TaxID=35708 RepID=A0A0A9H6F1_ARUDO
MDSLRRIWTGSSSLACGGWLDSCLTIDLCRRCVLCWSG